MTITFIVAELFLEGNDLFVYIEHKLILYTNAKNPNKQLKKPQQIVKATLVLWNNDALHFQPKGY